MIIIGISIINIISFIDNTNCFTFYAHWQKNIRTIIFCFVFVVFFYLFNTKITTKRRRKAMVERRRKLAELGTHNLPASRHVSN